MLNDLRRNVYKIYNRKQQIFDLQVRKTPFPSSKRTAICNMYVVTREIKLVSIKSAANTFYNTVI